MKSSLFFSLFVTCVFFSISLKSQQYNPCTRATPIHVIVLGSSTAAGTGPSSSDSAWVNRYRKHLQMINPANLLTNLAQGGTTTYHIMPDWYSAVNRPSTNTSRNISHALRLGADAIIVNMPSNDAANSFTVNEQLFNFQLLKSVADSAGIPIWICTTQPRNFNSIAQKKIQLDVRDSIFSIYGNFSIDFWGGFADTNNSIKGVFDSGDGVHLNDSAHYVLNQRVKDKLIPNFLIDTLASTDYTIVIEESLNTCGDSAEFVYTEITNLGATDTLPIIVNLEIRNVLTNTTVTHSDTIINGLNSCTNDTLMFSVNTALGGVYSIIAYLNSGNVNTLNDTFKLDNQRREPKLIISGNDVNYCSGDSAFLSVSSSVNSFVFWYDLSTSNTPIGTGQNYTFSPPNSRDTLYVEAVKGPLHFSNKFDLTQATNIDFNGYMFDIIAKDSVVIDSLSIPLLSTGIQGIQIYYKKGSYKSFEGIPSSWINLSVDTVLNLISKDQVFINFSPVAVSANDTLAFYLHLVDPSSRLSYKSSTNSFTVSDSKLIVPSGSGISHTFGATYYPRNFSGNIFYHFGYNPAGVCQSERIKLIASESSPYLNLGKDTIINSKDSITLSIKGFTNLMWSTGDTTSSVEVSKSTFGLGIHQISVIAIDSNGCSNLDTIIVEISPTAIIKSINLDGNRLSVWPNPTNGLINIYSEDQHTSLELYSNYGRLVKRLNRIPKVIDIRSYPKGWYILKFIQEHKVSYRKVLFR